MLINTSDFSEVSEEMLQDVEQTIPVSGKLHLPTWIPSLFESEPEDVAPEVIEKQNLSLEAIDLPKLPRIPIDDQPSTVNS